MPSGHVRQRPSLVLLLVLALALLGGSTAAARPGGDEPFVSANGVVLQQTQLVPVFRFSAPQVTSNGTSDLSQRFSGIYARQQVGGELYLGKPRFTVPNTRTLALLTQYGATGGFYALSIGEIGRETARGAVDTGQAQLLACTFLRQQNFIDETGALLLDQQTAQGALTPNPQNCDFTPDPQKPLYRTSLIQAAELRSENPQGAVNPATVGVLVQVPMTIPYGQRAVTQLPLGGPGGHISLLFRTTSDDQGVSLDSSVPGLAAVAMPFFGRSFSLLREVPIADPSAIRAQVEAQVRASYPGASSVSVPTPEVYYQVTDAAVEQKAVEPVLDFGGITVVDNGQTIVLRNIVVPLLQGGATGFGPSVSISAPASGSSFTPGGQISLSGQIGAGTPPYSYEWLSGEGESLGGPSSLLAAGSVSLQTNKLPVVGKGGTPSPVSVILRVTDADGAVREATVTLVPAVAPSLYLPLLATGASAQGATGAATLAQAGGYTFGIEANWDYPPSGAGGSDLPGVVPDANGFRSGMQGYGYSQRFSWNNGAAWEKDWRDCSLGGGDCSYGVDRADYVYYSGHGGAGGLSLASNVNSTWFDGINARYQTLRWVGFSSCQTLRVQGYSAPNEPIRRWFNAFRGAHILMGFNSNMRDIAFGGRLVDNMRLPTVFGIELPSLQQTVAQAWVNTAFQLNAGKPAYIYARGTNGANPANDKLPKPGQPMPARPFPVASWHWVWWDE